MAIEAITQNAASYQQTAESVTVKKPVANATVSSGTVSDYTEVAAERKLTGVEGTADSAKKIVKADEEDGATTEVKQNTEQIKKAVEKLNKKMGNSEAIFGIHEKTQRVTIKIVEKDTRKVLREFPPEETLDMIAKVWEQAGILVDEKK